MAKKIAEIYKNFFHRGLFDNDNVIFSTQADYELIVTNGIVRLINENSCGCGEEKLFLKILKSKSSVAKDNNGNKLQAYQFTLDDLSKLMMLVLSLIDNNDFDFKVKF